MIVQLRFLALCFAATLLAGSASQAADWGTLSGKFVVKGQPPAPEKLNINKDQEVCGKHNLVDESVKVGKGGELEDVVIYLRTKDVAVNPDYEKTAKDSVVLDNKNCRFEPHIQLLRASQTLTVSNSDPVGHNSNVSHPIAGQNVIIATGQKSELHFGESPLPVPVGCNIHPWMKGYVLIRKDPYMAVSDKDGSFEIKDMPAGKELEFQLWQEKKGYLKGSNLSGLPSAVKVDDKGRFKMKLKPGQNDLGTIQVNVAALK